MRAMSKCETSIQQSYEEELISQTFSVATIRARLISFFWVDTDSFALLKTHLNWNFWKEPCLAKNVIKI